MSAIRLSIIDNLGISVDADGSTVMSKPIRMSSNFEISQGDKLIRLQPSTDGTRIDMRSFQVSGSNVTEQARPAADFRRVLADNGNAAAPSYSFSNSVNTGMFLPGPNQLAFATDGTTRMTIDGAGRFGCGPDAYTDAFASIGAEYNGHHPLFRVVDTSSNARSNAAGGFVDLFKPNGPFAHLRIGKDWNSSIHMIKYNEQYQSNEGTFLYPNGDALMYIDGKPYPGSNPVWMSVFKSSLSNATTGGKTLTFSAQDNVNIGIGTLNPVYKLDVVGDINASGDVRNSGVTLTSDDRIKSDEVFLADAMSTLCKLRPQLYQKWDTIDYATDSNATSKVEAGLIAQEVFYDAEELRFLVSLPRDADSNLVYSCNVSSVTDPSVDPVYHGWGSDTASFNYIGLIPYLVKALQEKNAELSEATSNLQSVSSRLVIAESNLFSLDARLIAGGL